MTNEKFTKVVTGRLEQIKSTLTAKAEEYARGDRLSNFKSIAEMRSITPEDALLGLVAKHWIAINDFVADIDTGTVQPYERWNEKIGDVMAYMILLDALIIERLQSKGEQNDNLHCK